MKKEYTYLYIYNNNNSNVLAKKRKIITKSKWMKLKEDEAKSALRNVSYVDACYWC